MTTDTSSPLTPGADPRNTCARCGRVVAVEFAAPPDLWKATAREYEYDHLCISCFDERVPDDWPMQWESVTVLWPISRKRALADAAQLQAADAQLVVLTKIVKSAARMGICSQTHHEHLMFAARAALNSTAEDNKEAVERLVGPLEDRIGHLVTSLLTIFDETADHPDIRVRVRQALDREALLTENKPKSEAGEVE